MSDKLAVTTDNQHLFNAIIAEAIEVGYSPGMESVEFKDAFKGIGKEVENNEHVEFDSSTMEWKVTEEPEPTVLYRLPAEWHAVEDWLHSTRKLRILGREPRIKEDGSIYIGCKDLERETVIEIFRRRENAMQNGEETAKEKSEHQQFIIEASSVAECEAAQKLAFSNGLIYQDHQEGETYATDVIKVDMRQQCLFISPVYGDAPVYNLPEDWAEVMTRMEDEGFLRIGRHTLVFGKDGDVIAIGGHGGEIPSEDMKRLYDKWIARSRDV